MQALALRPGLSNRDLAARLSVDETEVSRLGRRLVEAGLVRKRKVGRFNYWEATGWGAQAVAVKNEGHTRSNGEAPSRLSLEPDVLRRLARQLVELQEAKGPASSSLFPLASLQGRIFSTILIQRGPVTIEEIVEQTGLAERTVELCVALLITRGFVTRSLDDSEGHPTRVIADADRYSAIGVKIIPNQLIGVLTNLRAEIVRVEKRDIKDTDPSRVLDCIVTLVRELRGETQHHDLPAEVVGLGVELAGHVDSRTGRVVRSPTMKWEGFDLGSKLQEQTGLVTVIENDVNALTIHEQLFVSGVGTDWFAVVQLSKGVGAGLVQDGQLSHGACGLAGELGHIVVDAGGRECRCGNTGCLESVAGVEGVLGVINDERLPGTPEVETFDQAAAMAESGNPVAKMAFRQAGDALGRGISILHNLANPERVLLAVPAALARPDSSVAREFERCLRAAMRKHVFSTADSACELEVRHIPSLDEYGARGAASAVLRRFMQRPLAWHGVTSTAPELGEENEAPVSAGSVRLRDEEAAALSAISALVQPAALGAITAFVQEAASEASLSG